MQNGGDIRLGLVDIQFGAQFDGVEMLEHDPLCRGGVARLQRADDLHMFVDCAFRRMQPGETR
ncbi:hypothetical protein D9M70_629610 [compost metagenome]